MNLFNKTYLKSYLFRYKEISKYLLFAACFSSFSFNNLILNQYTFLMGSLSFYFLVVSLMTLDFKIEKNEAKYFVIFLSYILLSVILTHYIFGNILSIKPFKTVIYFLFIFLVVQQVSFKIYSNKSFRNGVKNFFLFSGYLIIVTSLFDIYAIHHGGIQTSVFEHSYFKAWQPYTVSRLRGFTQEPSYFGMVLAVIIPFIISQFIKNKNIFNFIALVSIYVCIVFTLSKVAIITCTIISLLIILNNIRCLPSMILVFLFTFCALYFIGINQLIAHNYWYLSQWDIGNGGNAVLNINVDTSTLIRSGHIYACLKLWYENIIFGVGLGQSGFYLADYYPKYISSLPEVREWAKLSKVGGIPSFSFIPKIICELGLIGLLIISKSFLFKLRDISKFWKHDSDLRTFSYSFLGFLISSFGVEGYLYMPAWIVLGVIFGRLRINNKLIYSNNYRL